jgi:hypothetical protein
VGRLPVGREVVLAAEEVVVHPGRVWTVGPQVDLGPEIRLVVLGHRGISFAGPGEGEPVNARILRTGHHHVERGGDRPGHPRVQLRVDHCWFA